MAENIIKNLSLVKLKMALQGTKISNVWDLVDRACLELPGGVAEVLIVRLIRGDSLLNVALWLDSSKYCKVASLFRRAAIEERELQELCDSMIDLAEIPQLYEAQSAEVDATVDNGVMASSQDNFQEQTITFLDNQEIKTLDLSNVADPTRTREDQQIVNDLGNFLKRPRNIGRWSWVPGGNFDNANNFVTIDPWSLFLATPMQPKINNFRNFRCTGLHVQFRINGSPFHYGRLYVSYMPGPRPLYPYAGMGNPNDNTIQVNNFAGGLNTMARGLKTHWSQYPGVFIDPATNDVAEIVLPFFCPLNYVSLVGGIGGAPGQVGELGRLTIWVMNPLQCVNVSNTADITITATAWVEDPILTVPTVRNVYSGEAYYGQARAGSGALKSGNTKARNRSSNIYRKYGNYDEDPKNRPVNPPAPSKNQQDNSNQKKGIVDRIKSVNDEYGGGLVSAPATALAGFAGTLEKVPIIGPYATATKMALGKVSSIAKMFGFSKPLVVEPSKYVNQRPWSTMAVTLGDDTSVKLTLDPKQEITVDPVVTGLQDIDEMSFAHLFKRESLLAIVPWSQTADAGDQIFSLLVKPNACPANVSGTAIFFHTALSWASLPFRYWRGSLNYRIQIVSSQMHRGRLAFVFEPTRLPATSLPDQAITYQHFVDLTECRDYTFTVRYAAPVPWLMMHSPATQVITVGTSFNLVESNYSNGTLSCYVLNELSSPSETAPDVQINIFVSAGDDFMVAAPGVTDFDILSPFTPEIRAAYNGEAYFGQSADYTVFAENSPVSDHLYEVINGDDNDVPDIDQENLVFFGEQNVSLRALLKRYCLYRRYNLSQATGTGVNSYGLMHPHIPCWPGDAAPTSGIVQLNWVIGTSDNNGLFNFVKNTLLSYYRIGYAAYRGNVRYKYMVGGVTLYASASPGNILVQRLSIPTSSDLFLTNINTGPIGTPTDNENTKQMAMWTDANMTNQFEGTEIEFLRLKNGVEFEHPYYANQRFHFTGVNNQDIVLVTAGNTIKEIQQQSIARSRHRVVTFAQQSVFNNNPLGLTVDTYCAAGEDFSLHYFVAAPVLGFANGVPIT